MTSATLTGGPDQAALALGCCAQVYAQPWWSHLLLMHVLDLPVMPDMQTRMASCRQLVLAHVLL